MWSSHLGPCDYFSQAFNSIRFEVKMRYVAMYIVHFNVAILHSHSLTYVAYMGAHIHHSLHDREPLK